jgi:hypothetical protein
MRFFSAEIILIGKKTEKAVQPKQQEENDWEDDFDDAFRPHRNSYWASELVAEGSYLREIATSFQFFLDLHLVEIDASYYVAVSGVTLNKMQISLCVAVKEGDFTAATVRNLLVMGSLKARLMSIQEITMTNFFKMLHLSSMHNFINTEDDICKELGLETLKANFSDSGHHYGGPPFWSGGFGMMSAEERRITEELLVGTTSRKELLAKAKNMLCDDSLRIEIERIFRGKQNSTATISGHPVHYLLQADEKITRDKMVVNLLAALYQNGRLESRRYTELPLSGNSHLPASFLKSLYKASAGGTIIVSFLEDVHDGWEFADTGMEAISGLCEIIRQYRNQVLTVFCLKPEAYKAKKVFLEEIGSIAVVQVKQESAFGKQAKNYLSSLAAEYQITADKSLYKSIVEDKGYNVSDLDRIFNEWYDQRLRTTVYPEYAELETASKPKPALPSRPARQRH